MTSPLQNKTYSSKKNKQTPIQKPFLKYRKKGTFNDISRLAYECENILPKLNHRNFLLPSYVSKRIVIEILPCHNFSAASTFRMCRPTY